MKEGPGPYQWTGFYMIGASVMKELTEFWQLSSYSLNYQLMLLC